MRARVSGAALAVMLAGVALGGAEPLRVGMELEYPPFEFVGDDGEPDGVSVRMAEALAAHLGRPLEIKNLKFDTLPTALKTRAIDLVISSMTETEERREQIDFSDPYVTTGLAMLVAVDSEVRSREDLDRPGLKVVAKLGTTGETFARANLPGAEVLALPEDPACALEVAQGKADVWIYDQLSIFQYQKQHPDTTRALLKPIREEHWAVGIRKGNTELLEQVNGFLAAFRAAGGFDALGERYLREEKALVESMGLPFIFGDAPDGGDVAVADRGAVLDGGRDPLFAVTMVALGVVALLALYLLTRERGGPAPGARDWVGYGVLWALLAGVCSVVYFSMGDYHWQWGGIWARRWELFGGWCDTLWLSLATLLLCTVLAVALVVAGRSRSRPLRFFARAYTEIVRGSPLIVVLLVGHYVVGNAFGLDDTRVAGVLLLALFTAAYLGEILRGGIESVSRTQFESARAVGFDRAAMYRHVILPQAVRRVLPAVAGLFIMLVKDSSLLSYIGTPEFKKAMDGARAATYTGLEAYLPLAAGYLMLTLPLAWFASRLERRFAYES